MSILLLTFSQVSAIKCKAKVRAVNAFGDMLFMQEVAKGLKNRIPGWIDGPIKKQDAYSLSKMISMMRQGLKFEL